MGARHAQPIDLDVSYSPVDTRSIRKLMKLCARVSKRLSLQRFIDIRGSVQKAKAEGYYEKWINEYESAGVRSGTWYALLALKLTNVSRVFQIGPRLTERELMDYIRVRRYQRTMKNLMW